MNPERSFTSCLRAGVLTALLLSAGNALCASREPPPCDGALDWLQVVSPEAGASQAQVLAALEVQQQYWQARLWHYPPSLQAKMARAGQYALARHCELIRSLVQGQAG